MKKTILFLFIISICLVGIYVLLDKGYIRANYPSFNKYPVHGVDISHHQYDIDWDKLLKEEGRYVQFVFMKATEGATHQDRKFHDNWEACEKHNVARGAYHFFTFCMDGISQAQNFINTVPFDSLALPPVIDLEYGGNCKEENRLPNYMEEVSVFIQMVEDHYKKKVIIYATPDFYSDKLSNRFLDNPIWIRSIFKEPKLENNRSWLFWQYANKGRLNGVEALIDINVFGGTIDGLDSLRIYQQK